MTGAAERLDVRVMGRADLDRTLDWAAAEGWNPGRGDARAFQAADPLGFFMGWCDGRPAAAISVVAYGPDFGFLGLYIVPPEFRRRGHGLALWQEAMARRPARCIGLDGVVAQQANYARSGFALAHRNIRYGGRIAAAARVPPTIVPAESVPFDRLAAYDRLCFPAPRPAFLTAWLAPENGLALATLGEGAITGLGAIRACRAGFKIGPLFADDEATAEALLRALAAHAGGAEVFLDTPDTNAAARRMAERHGMTPVFETARMYTAAPPPTDPARVFGITTFELG